MPFDKLNLRAATLACLLAGLCAAPHAQETVRWRGRTVELGTPVVPAGVVRDAGLPYGPDPAQRIDVYRPAQARQAPVLVMVHGGGWMYGDKAAASVVDAKIDHWVRERGFVLVSVGYRLVPQVTVLQQAEDIARALARVQAQAATWGADPRQVVLMGHSAGAHLVALLSAAPDLVGSQGARSWRATIALDSAALDTVALMQRRHLPLYDRAFGPDPALWTQVSPTARLSPGGPPMLLVCSAPRRDDACGQSQRFAQAVGAVGGNAEVLPLQLDHGQINAQLGAPGDYTAAVDRFIDRRLHAPS
ncbi:MAG: alpha/beta hydrolase [Pseudomonadota bacterium]|nr:alpha/beta hydrolase [Pseudomonadota bacterium]